MNGESLDLNLDFLKANESTIDIDTLTLEGDVAEESVLFLMALREECTDAEYQQIVTESANELELYGLISSADVVLEAQKNIVKMNKIATFNKIQKRAAIALAAKAGDMWYEKYAKFRKLMIEARLKIYEKYGNKSKVEARKAIANARRKASGMKSDSGKSIVEKMDHHIANLDKNGRNGAAVAN